MKKLVFLLLVVLSAVPCSAERLFPSLYERNDVNVTYVSKTLLSSIVGRLNVRGQSLASQVSNLNSVNILSSDTPEGSLECRNAIEDFLRKNNNCEVLMESKDAESINVIYGEPYESEDSTFSRLIIVNFEISNKKISEADIVVIDGKIKLSQSTD